MCGVRMSIDRDKLMCQSQQFWVGAPAVRCPPARPPARTRKKLRLSEKVGVLVCSSCHLITATHDNRRQTDTHKARQNKQVCEKQSGQRASRGRPRMAAQHTSASVVIYIYIVYRYRSSSGFADLNISLSLSLSLLFFVALTSLLYSNV